MSLKLNSSGGGSVTLQEPTTASARTLSLPDVTGTVITSADTGTVTPTMLSQKLTMATAQNTTSGTVIDFTSIPSWVRRITIMFNGVSTNGTTGQLIQLGDSGGFETTGYVSTGSVSTSMATSTAGYVLFRNSAANTITGSATITNVSGNIWIFAATLNYSDASLTGVAAGNKTLSDTLTQVRITTVNGTDTFDAGSVNIMYEG